MNLSTYTLELQNLLDSLPPQARKPFLQTYGGRMKDPSVALALSGFLGVFGGDRFYIGDTALGILKLISFGGLGIWVIVDMFLIGGKVRAQNIKIARQILKTMSSSVAAPSCAPATELDPG